MRDDSDESGFDVLLSRPTPTSRATARPTATTATGYAWGLAVLDEAHALKSAASSRSQRLSQLQTQQRLLLTGTPVQNNLGELLSLLTYMLPKVFPPQLGVAFAEDERQVRRARRLLAPFILRRKKSDVLSQLANKVEEELQVAMNAKQQSFYSSLLSHARLTRTSSALSRKATTSLFFDLRKAANHPCLMQRHYCAADLAKIATAALEADYFGNQCRLQQVETELATFSDFQLHEVCAELPALRRCDAPTTKGERGQRLCLGRQRLLDDRAHHAEVELRVGLTLLGVGLAHLALAATAALGCAARRRRRAPARRGSSSSAAAAGCSPRRCPT